MYMQLQVCIHYVLSHINIKYGTVYIQYNIVFTMKFTISILFVLICIYTLSAYDMTDTALGNAGLNAKPIDSAYFTDLQRYLKNRQEVVISQ